ncbi:MAG: hypothetical protein ACD_75C01266G0002 [uncultured bacterium]|nr:MAG: hypothetical protein ACD_75C01266G0002 [uncultured bacterium]
MFDISISFLMGLVFIVSQPFIEALLLIFRYSSLTASNCCG